MGFETIYAQDSKGGIKFFDRDGVRVAYAISEPTSRPYPRDHAMVFIHGALCDHSDWSSQWRHFASSHRILALDLVGHGQTAGAVGRMGIKSYAKDIQGLCRELGLSKIVLVAHSMGCRVALQCALDMPDAIASLVLLDGAYLSPRPTTGLPTEARQSLAQAAHQQVLSIYSSAQVPDTLRAAFGQMFFDERFSGLKEKVIARALTAPETLARELMPDFAAWDVMNMENALRDITVPILAICSTAFNSSRRRIMLSKDDSSPWLQALQSHAKSAEIVRYSDAGHFVMVEQPERVNADIERHLQRIRF